MNEEGIDVVGGWVDLQVRKDIPKPGEDITECIIDLKWLIENLYKVNIYYRKDDPVCGESWMIDFFFDTGLFPKAAIKLPKEMTKDQVMDFCKPLLESREEYIKSKLN